MTTPVILLKPTFSAKDYPSRISALIDAMQPAVNDPAFPWAYDPANTSGLNFFWAAGEWLVDGVKTAVAAGSVALTANADNYVEATRAGVVSINTTGFTPGRIPLYTVTTGLLSITAMVDHRQFNQPTVGRCTIATVGGTTTLTADQARAQIMEISGTLTSNATIHVPTGPWVWFLQNKATGPYTVTVKVAGQTGVVVPNGKGRFLYVNDTDAIDLTGFLMLTGGQMQGQIDETAVSIASAATTDIGSAAGNVINITGTTTITALGTAQAGARRHIRFAGILTLTHNVTSLILPGSANITTAVGDTALMISLGGGNWYCDKYTRADGGITVIGSLDVVGSVVNEAKSANISAAATTNIGGMAGNYATITNTSGSTTITALGTAPAGASRTVTFSITGGSITLQNSAAIVLPGEQNIPITSGDSATFRSLGGGNWYCVDYQKNTMTAAFWNIVNKSSTYTVSSSDRGAYFVCTQTADMTLNLPAAGTVGANFVFAVSNRGTAGTKVTINPNASELVDGNLTLDLYPGSATSFICDGTGWKRMETGVVTVTGTFTTGSATFNASGSWVVPAGVYSVRASTIGGGSGGADAGGNGGGYAQKVFSFTPGDTYTITVGAGGAGAAANGTSGAGGTSSFSGNAGTISATGGAAVVGNTPSTAGTGSGGTTNITGGTGAAGGGFSTSNGGGGGGSAPGKSGGATNGSPGSGSSTSSIGGAGGAGSGGAGGAQVTGSGVNGNTGVAATANESGGGGGGAGSSAVGGNGAAPGGGGGGGGTTGGAGAAGRVYLEW